MCVHFEWFQFVGMNVWSVNDSDTYKVSQLNYTPTFIVPVMMIWREREKMGGRKKGKKREGE